MACGKSFGRKKKSMAASAVRLAHGALFFAAFIYSGWNVVLSSSLESLSPVTFSLCREICAIPLLYLFAAKFEGPLRVPGTAREWRYVVMFGGVLGLFQLCFAVGVKLTSSTAAAVFQCVEPSTAAVIGAAVGLEPCTVAKFASAILAGGGVLVLQLGSGEGDAAAPRPPWQRGLGSFLLFCQGVGIATYCLLQKQLVRGAVGGGGASADEDDDGTGAAADDDDGDDEGRGGRALLAPLRSAAAARQRPWGPITLTAHACAGSCVVMTVAALVDTAAGLESPPPLSRRAFADVSTAESVAALAYAVVLSSIVGYSLRAWANKHVDAATLVLYNAVQPPLTSIIQVVLHPRTSTYGPKEAGATALAVLAVVVAAREKKKTPKPPARDPETLN